MTNPNVSKEEARNLIANCEDPATAAFEILNLHAERCETLELTDLISDHDAAIRQLTRHLRENLEFHGFER